MPHATGNERQTNEESTSSTTATSSQMNIHSTVASASSQTTFSGNRSEEQVSYERKLEEADFECS